MNHFQRLYDTTVRTLDGLSGNGYGKEQDDRLRQEGTIATRNGEEVKWNKGDWVPTNEYKKPKKFEIEVDNITDNITHALNGDLGYRHLNTVRNEAVKMVGGVAHYVSTNVTDPLKTVSEDYGNGHYEPNGAGENLAVGIGSGLRLAEWGLDKAGDAGEYLGNHLDIDPRVSRFVAEEALTALATAGSSTVLKQGLKVANKLDNLIPPNTPQLAIAKGGAHVQIPTATPDELLPQVMEAASTLPTPTNWQGRARTLYGNQDHKALADMFRRGQGGKLSKKNTFITADELALNKNGVLDQQLERADKMIEQRTKWSKQGKEIKGDRQRELYDTASLNPNHNDIEMYKSDTARKYITKFTNVLSEDQWHHIFGNKEAGEFILSMAHSDPLVAANLFKKMEALGLNSSGVSKNIAILKEAKHSNWHDFIKDMGMEPKSPGKSLSVKGSTAPGDFADLSQELGRAIAAGKGDINDAFKLLELYSSYNKWMMKQITSKRFGGKIINELPEGVGKAIQIGGYQKRPTKSKHKPLPKL